MSKKSKSSAFRIVGEQLFHGAEKDRLKTMQENVNKREQKPHRDFLTLAHDNADNGHQIATEYHASNFWQHYYEGEPPYPVLRGDSLPRHEYGTGGDNNQSWNTMLNPDETTREVDTTGTLRLDYSEQILSQKHWMDHMCLADTAMRHGDLTEAAYHLAVARVEAERWGTGNERLLETDRCIESVRAALKVRPS